MQIHDHAALPLARLAALTLEVAPLATLQDVIRWGFACSPPHEIVVPFARPVGTRGFSHWFPYAEYQTLRDQTTTLASVVAYSAWRRPVP